MSDWPLKYHDAAASNATDSLLAPPLRLRWKQKVRKARYAVCNGKMLFVLGYENLYGLDLRSGTLLREYEKTSSLRHDKVAQQVACDKGLLLYASGRRIAAMHPDSARRVWEMDLPVNPCGPLKPLVCAGGRVLFPGMTLSAKDGTILHDYHDLCPAGGGLIATHGEFVVAYNREPKQIVCLEGAPPRRKWVAELPGECMAMEMNARFLFAIIRGPEKDDPFPTYAWELNTGNLVWKGQLGIQGHCVTEGYVFMASCHANAYICIDAETGKEVWRNKERFTGTGGPPVASKDFVWLRGWSENESGKETGWIAAASRDSGETAWRFELPEFPEHIAIVDERLVVTCERMVYCYEPADANSKTPTEKSTGDRLPPVRRKQDPHRLTRARRKGT